MREKGKEGGTVTGRRVHCALSRWWSPLFLSLVPHPFPLPSSLPLSLVPLTAPFTLSEPAMKFRSLGLTAVLSIPLVLSACGYNSIQSMDERAKAAKQQIAVQLQRRADLVPNLVATVKGYAAQEVEIFESVAKARAGLAGAVSGGNVTEMANANQQLGGALTRLLAISENYPTLKSDQTFLRLQEDRKSV